MSTPPSSSARRAPARARAGARATESSYTPFLPFALPEPAPEPIREGPDAAGSDPVGPPSPPPPRAPRTPVPAPTGTDHAEPSEAPAVTIPVQQRPTGVRSGGDRARPGALHRPVRPGRSAGSLLREARDGVIRADYATRSSDRYAHAHLAALRAAAAVLEAVAPRSRKARPMSAWTLLGDAAPDLAPWAAYFAAGSNTRAAAEAGQTRLVTDAVAAEMVSQARRFVDLVGARLAGDEPGGGGGAR